MLCSTTVRSCAAGALGRSSLGASVVMLSSCGAFQLSRVLSGATLPSLHHRQHQPPLLLLFLNLLPSAAQLSDRIGREDIDLLFAQPGFAALDFFLEPSALLEQLVEDLLFGHVGDLFPLHVDDAAAVA